jgi:hypothetical protein
VFSGCAVDRDEKDVWKMRKNVAGLESATSAGRSGKTGKVGRRAGKEEKRAPRIAWECAGRHQADSASGSWENESDLHMNAVITVGLSVRSETAMSLHGVNLNLEL